MSEQQTQGVALPEDGKPLSDEYLQHVFSTKRLIQMSIDTVSVARVVADALVRQGLLTQEALDNVAGSQIGVKDGVFFLTLHGVEPFKDDAITEINPDAGE